MYLKLKIKKGHEEIIFITTVVSICILQLRG